MSSNPVPGNFDATRIASAVPDDATYVRPSVQAAPAPEAAAGPATVLFSLGIGAGEDPATAPVTWLSDLPVVHMLADLLSASSCCASPEEGGLLAATAASPLQAVILATRAQRLADAYAQHPAAALRSLSIAVYSPASGATDESALRTYLKGSRRSGEVLLAGGAYRQLESVPGLQIRRVPVSSGQRLELHELVMPITDRSSQPAARKPKTPVQPQSTLAETVVVQAVPLQAVSLQGRREVEIEEPAAKSGPSKLVIGAIAAVLLVGAGVAVKFSGGHAAPAAVAKPAESTAAPTPVAPVSASLVENTTPAAAPHGAGKIIPVPVAAAPAEKKAVPVPHTAEPTQEAPAPAHESVSRGGYSAEQIRSILDKADTLAGNGRYDEAIYNYNVVLANDPGNAHAREGKSRAVTNKSMK